MGCAVADRPRSSRASSFTTYSAEWISWKLNQNTRPCSPPVLRSQWRKPRARVVLPLPA